MKGAPLFALALCALLTGGAPLARADDVPDHRAAEETLVMTKGGVGQDVILERVRRMPEVPRLDAEAMVELMNQGVSSKVLLALAGREGTTCELSEPPVRVSKVLDHPDIRRILDQVDEGVTAAELVKYVGKRKLDLPVLDGFALSKLRNEGVPNSVLLVMMRKQEEPVGCGPARSDDLRAAPIPRTKPAATTSKKAIPPEDPIRGVLRLVDQGASTEVIVEYARQAENVPKLDARTLTRLKKKHVPEEVVVELIRHHEADSPVEPPVETFAASAVQSPPKTKEAAPNPKETKDSKKREKNSTVDGSIALGGVRVLAKSSEPVTYLEVLVDGNTVLREGRLPQGNAAPGWTLQRPLVLEVKQGLPVFESELPAGLHEVRTIFGLTHIVETEWDATLKAHGQRYDTTMVGPEGEKPVVPTCDIQEGWVCVLEATLVKKGKGYVVIYDVSKRRGSKQAEKDQNKEVVANRE